MKSLKQKKPAGGIVEMRKKSSDGIAGLRKKSSDGIAGARQKKSSDGIVVDDPEVIVHPRLRGKSVVPAGTRVEPRLSQREESADSDFEVIDPKPRKKRAKKDPQGPERSSEFEWEENGGVENFSPDDSPTDESSSEPDVQPSKGKASLAQIPSVRSKVPGTTTTPASSKVPGTTTAVPFGEGPHYGYKSQASMSSEDEEYLEEERQQPLEVLKAEGTELNGLGVLFFPRFHSLFEIQRFY